MFSCFSCFFIPSLSWFFFCCRLVHYFASVGALTGNGKYPQLGVVQKGGQGDWVGEYVGFGLMFFFFFYYEMSGKYSGFEGEKRA